MRPDHGPILRAILLRVVLLGLLVLVAVGLRAGSPLDASRERWRLDDVLERSGGPLQILLLVWVVLVLGLVVWSLTQGRERSSAQPPRRSAMASLATFLALVLVAFLVSRSGRQSATSDPSTSATPAADVVREPTGPPMGQDSFLLVGLLVLVALMAVMFSVWRRRALPVEEEPGDAPLVEGLMAAARVLRERTGDEPRERVVAAYEAFELALAGRGVRRGGQWDTQRPARASGRRGRTARVCRGSDAAVRGGPLRCGAGDRGRRAGGRARPR